MHIDIHEQTEDNLAQLVKRAVAGEEIIFDSNGTSVAKLIPLKQGANKPRRGGQWKGKVKIADDFDELPEPFMAAFRGEKRRCCI
ncbi:type II toxin-antitoxin system prevent-host-death family antitoxin [Candidatus Poribacteria bacterium]|nr:MAG: type II toxin-antitoxin system prevent-host-death family antitoxin [Candidatus Poribacteria bacterium]